MSEPAARSSGIGPDGEWREAFPGQRQPFRPGHTVSITHGAKSPRIWQPLAAEIRAGVLESWPHLRAPEHGPALDALCRAEAMSGLLCGWLLQTGIPERGPEPDERRAALAARRSDAVCTEWLRHSGRAARLRERLGMTVVAWCRANPGARLPGFPERSEG